MKMTMEWFGGDLLHSNLEWEWDGHLGGPFLLVASRY